MKNNVKKGGREIQHQIFCCTYDNQEICQLYERDYK